MVYLAKFIENDMKQDALFSKEGNMIYNVIYGFEKNLPEEVRSKIAETYPDYKITYTAKVNQSNRDIWMINLEGFKSIMIVRYEDGDVGEINSYKKSM
jgi:hypothetical protein